MSRMTNIVAVALVLVAAATAAHAADQPAWSEAWGSARIVEKTASDVGADVGRQLIDATQRHAVFVGWVDREISRLRQENEALRRQCGDRCADPVAGQR